uniref:PD-(D/E)XK nuclease superfamily protein n=1 Tax=Candidatus Kentrum sp. MB TaxID=2138164 RepID=A0A451B7P1_9GAMM|nr:MAG: PD-(D/E)XK nuclease superfamily protein [Candidatus Kentron sp. MB]VFK30631.1 MAG: PD-(D/E)XK nuclease superfamily protein [Candidatus Kentron sp. MB]VFK74300.1 MAG: PD-(D/E)XK nuclease superfamily protein [Candidatus Kentron sp. MB]
MTTLKKLPIGIQDFETLRDGGYLYIDKTESIHRMITSGVAFFLSRPRRFGKSLLVSTLAAIFEGRRDLFEGLWIASPDAEYDWPVHPVLHLDMSRADFRTLEELEPELIRQLDRCAIKHGLEPIRLNRAGSVLDELIEQLAKKKGKVVMLIDEYDKPILDHLTDIPLALEVRDRLRSFYTILKAQGKNLRFVFLTGVSRFSKVSVFSEMNHLNDITYDKRYAHMPGYTQTELETDFSEHIRAIARQKGLSESDLLDRIRFWYNGYRFHPDIETIYNPFSCLLYLDKQEFKHWWFETGTPRFLINMLRESPLSVEELGQKVVVESDFANFQVDRLKPLPLLHQTGYLTIVGYDPESRLYTLDYPNREVREGFLTHLAELFSGSHSEHVAGDLWRLRNALIAGDMDTFFAILESILAGIPYDIQLPRERYYQSLLYLIFQLLGLHVHVEVRTATGRIDATVELESKVWIFEFKLDGNAEAALDQIREKGYAAPYAASGKAIYLVGVGFDSEQRNIGDWKMIAASR